MSYGNSHTAHQRVGLSERSGVKNKHKQKPERYAMITLSKCSCEGTTTEGPSTEVLAVDSAGIWYNCLHCGTTKLELNEETKKLLKEHGYDHTK